MNWTVNIVRSAARQLRDLPRDRQAQIRQRLREFATNPYQGDVRPLRGEWQGYHRRRVGRYRIIFQIDTENRHVDIVAILPRGTQTY